jgi:hypothetical protein
MHLARRAFHGRLPGAKRSMNRGSLRLTGTLLAALSAGSCRVAAQTNSPQKYTLLAGSQLTDDCPICDRPTISVSMTGTFELHLLDQNPLFSRFELLNVVFNAGTNPGPEYKVVGSGIYQVGGEVAPVQNLFLDVEINNGFTNTEALCTNVDAGVKELWPKIQVSVDQTNGTPGQVYHLTLMAIPVPAISPFVVDYSSASVRLEWDAKGGVFQVERAPEIGGPYSALAAATTNSTFTDVGILTNQPQSFYRLRQF